MRKVDPGGHVLSARRSAKFVNAIPFRPSHRGMTSFTSRGLCLEYAIDKELGPRKSRFIFFGARLYINIYLFRNDTY